MQGYDKGQAPPAIIIACALCWFTAISSGLWGRLRSVPFSHYVGDLILYTQLPSLGSNMEGDKNDNH